jgi:hypothetical protein
VDKAPREVVQSFDGGFSFVSRFRERRFSFFSTRGGRDASSPPVHPPLFSVFPTTFATPRTAHRSLSPSAFRFQKSPL